MPLLISNRVGTLSYFAFRALCLVAHVAHCRVEKEWVEGRSKKTCAPGVGDIYAFGPVR